MSGAGTQNSLRKALGALKDTTTVSLAKVNSDYKVLVIFIRFFLGFFQLRIQSYILVRYKTLQELDIAVVKATNHVERPAKEKHIRGGCSLSFSKQDGMHSIY